MVKLYPNKIPRKLFVSVVDYEQESAVAQSKTSSHFSKNRIYTGFHKKLDKKP